MFDVLRMKKGIMLKLWPLIQYQIRNIFMEKSCRKWAPNASPRPLCNFVNNLKQSLHARNSFKNKIFWKGINKSLLKSKLYFFFSLSIGVSKCFYQNFDHNFKIKLKIFKPFWRHKETLRKKYPYSELFWSAFFPHFPAFRLNTERCSGKSGKKCGSE